MNEDTDVKSTGQELLLDKIRVGISSCLLGEEVRFNGGHKRDSYVTGTLPFSAPSRPLCDAPVLPVAAPERADVA